MSIFWIAWFFSYYSCHSRDQEMEDPLSSLSLPSFPFFCNVVVFPSTDNTTDDDRFFLIKKTADVPDEITGKICVEYIPGSV